MSSYNKVNGIHTSSNYELLTEILRGEWGFEGLVMTDWGSQSDKTLDLHAGNHLIMGGYRTQYLTAALQGERPEFAEDGYVREEIFDVYGGFIKETVSYWNAFLPMAAGPDTVTARVNPGLPLNRKIPQMEQEGIAQVTQNPDGSQTVCYRGIDRGAYLSLGDVQKCAIQVLKFLAEIY
jgi:Beta-glucosidase-related glycosidases